MYIALVIALISASNARRARDDMFGSLRRQADVWPHRATPPHRSTTIHHQEELGMIARARKTTSAYVSRFRNTANQCFPSDASRRRHVRLAAPSDLTEQRLTDLDHRSTRAPEHLRKDHNGLLWVRREICSALFIKPWSDLRAVSRSEKRAQPTPAPITDQCWHASTPGISSTMALRYLGKRAQPTPAQIAKPILARINTGMSSASRGG
jgi:hypothetical protein